jgi:hypothetical protein
MAPAWSGSRRHGRCPENVPDPDRDGKPRPYSELMMEPLDANTRLFAALDHAQVRFCHWKSNRHLDRAMAGAADLDLLVSARDRELFDRIVRERGFIDLVQSRLRALPGIEDRLGFDETTGRLSHLHVHFQLVLGEKRVKHHRLPIEEWLLEDLHRLGGIPVPAAKKELFLLYIRAILKSDPRAAVRTVRGLRPHAVPEEIFEEARWLLTQISDDELVHVAESADLGFLAEDFEDFISRVRRDGLSPGYVVREKRRLLSKLRKYQRYSTAAGSVRKVWFRVRYSRPSSRIAPVPRKHLDHPGLFLAIVGADGSGKTTLVTDLTDWLGWKVETRRTFFGLPKNSIALRGIRKARYGVSYLARRRWLPSRSRAVVDDLAESLEAVEWLYVAIGRVARESLAKRAMNAGEVVIAERYPLVDIADSMDVPMDGPRLQGTGKAMVRAAALERRLYDRIGAAKPLYLLEADVGVLAGRRPNDDPVRLSSKAAAVQAAIETGRYESVATDRPYADVLMDLKRRIWRLL